MTSTSREAATVAPTALPAASRVGVRSDETAASGWIRSCTRSWPTSGAGHSPTTSTLRCTTTATGRSATPTTTSSSNKSTDGGETWIGPTRVNNDRSDTPSNRDCGRRASSVSAFGTGAASCPAAGTGNDQWFPWITINTDGDINVTFHDRRLDTTSPAGVGPCPRARRWWGTTSFGSGARAADHVDADGAPVDDRPGSGRGEAVCRA